MSDIAVQAHVGFTPAMRFFVGACGGLAAVCVKFLGQDLEFMQQLLEAGDPVSRAKLFSLGMAYSVLAPILMFLGGLIGWASEEKSRLKLLAMGVAAPALVTTWAGGAKPADLGSEIAAAAPAAVGQLLPVTPAFAGERVRLAEAPGLGQGIQLFFGIGKQQPRFAVVVGEHETEDEARRQAKAVKAESPGLEVETDGPMPDGTWRVLVGDYSSHQAAEQAASEIDALPSVRDAGVSAIQ